MLYEFCDAAHKFGLDSVYLRIGEPEVREDVATTLDDRSHGRRPFAWSTAARSRLLIKSMSGFGVAMPRFASLLKDVQDVDRAGYAHGVNGR